MAENLRKIEFYSLEDSDLYDLYVKMCFCLIVEIENDNEPVMLAHIRSEIARCETEIACRRDDNCKQF